MILNRLAAALAALLLAGPAAAEDDPIAKRVFGAATTPAPAQPAQVFGSYAKGCLAGALQLAEDGPRWQAMRLSRGRRWGHPALVDFLTRFSEASALQGHHGLLIGDMAQVRGGPMLSGHRSHQIGLDVDVWLRPSPPTRFSAEERESVSSYDVTGGEHNFVMNDALWEQTAWRMIRVAAEDASVARIFVNPAIKRRLCELHPAEDRAWLRKVRPWWGHDSHFHVRLSCPIDSPACVNQAAPPPGDGCGDSLDWWFTDEPYGGSSGRPKDLRMSDLPAACKQVAAAP